MPRPPPLSAAIGPAVAPADSKSDGVENDHDSDTRAGSQSLGNMLGRGGVPRVQVRHGTRARNLNLKLSDYSDAGRGVARSNMVRVRVQPRRFQN